MLEMAAASEPGLYRAGVAGDTFNTAVYLARAGLDVAYLTRLGDDSFSGDILRRMREEGIGTELVERCAGARPGLYLISNDARGERHFHYWRDAAPVRSLFDQPLPAPDAGLFYFSGITLAVTRSGRDNFLRLLGELRARGCRIAYDSNYRPQLWDSVAQAREYNRSVLPLCDIALPTLADDCLLWDISTVQACRALYADAGTGEIVVKAADLTAQAFAGPLHAQRRAAPVRALDTTGAGDAFNAGYLAARLNGASLDDALRAAQALAATVVQYHGAIIPREDATQDH
ncbi:MAG: sugar kinase [Halioglobus sp.]|nr:sugar kinase [Halioglobus sp.]